MPWTRDAHFLAGIRKVLLPDWESLPIFLLPLARLLGQLTRGSLCLVSTQHGNADQGCLAFRDRQENIGVGKSLLPCRAGAGHATGITQSIAHGSLWVLRTLAHCWGIGAGLAVPGTGQGRRGTLSRGLVFSEPDSAPGWHESLTPGQNSARCPWHHPAQTSCDRPVRAGACVATCCPETERGKLPAAWLGEELFHLGCRAMAEEPVALGVGSLTPHHSGALCCSAGVCSPLLSLAHLGVSEPSTPGLCPGGLLSSPVPHSYPKWHFSVPVSHAVLLQYSPGHDLSRSPVPACRAQ